MFLLRSYFLKFFTSGIPSIYLLFLYNQVYIDRINVNQPQEIENSDKPERINRKVIYKLSKKYAY